MALVRELKLGNTKVKIMDDYIIKMEEVPNALNRIGKIGYEVYKEKAIKQKEERGGAL